MRLTNAGASIGGLTLVIVLAGCGGGGGAPAQSTTHPAGGSTSIKVGIIPTAEFMPVYIAQDQGLFKEEGLEVEVSTVASAAAIVPSVLNGQLDFGAAATAPFLIANDKNLPIKAVAANAGVAPSSSGVSASILVLSDSSIRAPADLEGKKLAVNALGSLSHVAASAVVSAAGGDPKQVQFIAMPFPDESAALRQKRVDAIATSEPFLTQDLTAGGVRAIAPLYADTYPTGTTYSLMFASQKLIGSNPDLVNRFQRVIKKVNTQVNANPELVRAALVKYGKLPPNVAEKVNLPLYATDFDVAGVQKMADLMLQDGFISKKADAKSVSYQGS